MTTQVDFKVRSSHGESQFKILHHASSVPYAFLQRASSTNYDGSWSGANWLPFSSRDENLDRSNAMICRAQDSDRKTTYRVVVKHVAGDIFATCKLESSVKLKELQALPTTAPVWSSLESCSVVPDWTHQSMAQLSLEPPTSERAESLITPELTPTAQAPLPTEPNLDDPVILLQYKYYDLIYANQTLPLVHFAKSTLAKLRSLYRSRHRDDKAAYKTALWECLKTVALTTDQLDTRYDVPKVIGFIKGESLHPLTTCALEEQYLRFWSSSLRNDPRKAIEQVKVRELQLQVILLLEMLATQPASEKKTTKPESKPAYAAISLVRKKKKPKKEALVPLEESGEFDPDSLVDLAFDRLCIWQAFSASLTISSKKEKGPDVPYDLCKHVLVPYYGKVLPAKTKILAKKATGTINRLSKTNRQSKDKDSDRKVAPPTRSETASNTSLLDEPTKKVRPTALEEAKKSLLMSKHQVDLNKPRKQQQHATATPEEIADAVRNISKPNRMRTANELVNSKPFVVNKPARKSVTTIAKKKEVIQVAAADNLVTPSMNRKRFKNFEFSTPVKKFKLGGTDGEAESDDEQVIGSSPFKTPVKQHLEVIACTPLKAGNSSDTDEDML